MTSFSFIHSFFPCGHWCFAVSLFFQFELEIFFIFIFSLRVAFLCFWSWIFLMVSLGLVVSDTPWVACLKADGSGFVSAGNAYGVSFLLAGCSLGSICLDKKLYSLRCGHGVFLYTPLNGLC